MENASKALIIAGGILLAILILSVLVSVGISMSDMAGAQDKKIEAQQVQEFNDGYLAYNKTRMYGTDVLTVFNKAHNENDYNITIKAIDKDENVITIENTKEFKVSVFECVKDEISYDNKTGRINKMVFRKIEI